LVGSKRWKRELKFSQFNIKMDLDEMEEDGGTDWIDLAQDRNSCRAVVYTVISFRIP
jgi:hypothetical protein